MSQSTDGQPPQYGPISSPSPQKTESTDISDSLNRLSINSPQQPPSPTVTTPSRLNRKASSPLINRNDGRPVSRRTSSYHSIPPSPGRATTEQHDDPAPVTAATVASAYFKQELERDAADSSSGLTDTVVLIQDSCYGHRFSRPKSSKNLLNLIVERPERIRAGVLGLSTSYVRSGGRHFGSSHPPTPSPSGSPALAPFRIQKTTRSVPVTAAAVASVHGAKWMQELKTMCDAAESKLLSGKKELSRPETPTGHMAQADKPQLHEGDLYLCRESLNAFQGALGGVFDGVDAVFNPASSCKKAFVCVRPPGHHCSSSHPSGFCWLNNVHVGIEHAAQSHGLTHAAIIDFDLHHGDGSQAITWERNLRALKTPKPSGKNAQTAIRKPFIGYFSLHDVNSYPCEDGDQQKITNASVCIDSAHGQSIWNIHLQPWKTEAEFWQLYESRYVVLLDKARAFLRSHNERIRSMSPKVQPKAAIFLSAGFDASEWEMQMMQRHKVNVPTEFYARFTADVVKLAEEEDLAVDGRIISVLEGGYSDRALMSGVLSHLSGLVTNSTGPSDATLRYDTNWWSPSALAELENLMRPPPPVQPPKKPARNVEAPTYTSPTQSFTAKVVDPAKMYRSISGASVQTPPKSRPVTPPPPDVDWATAAYELSKLLIPNDRSTASCTHEDLNEPRVKRERHSSIGLPSLEASGAENARMQLRGRKSRNGQTTPATETADPSQKAPTAREKANRRRTISDLPSIADEGPSGTVERLMTNGSDTAAGPDHQSKAVSGVSSTSSNGHPPTTGNMLKVSKVRRPSATKSDLTLNHDHKPPPVPKPPENDISKSVTQPGQLLASNGSSTTDGLDQIASGVQKITLHMSDQKTSGLKQGGATSTKARKPPVAREPKTSTARTTASKATKAPRASAKAIKSEPSGMIAQPPAEVVAVSHDTTPLPETNGDEQISRRGAGEVNKASLPTAVSSSVPPTAHQPEPVAQSPQASLESDSLSDAARPGNEPQLQANLSSDSNVKTVTEFIPYQPQGQAAPAKHSAHPANEPLTWLPPNTNTPEQTPQKPLRGKENLPVFTAKSPIPFAPTKAVVDSVPQPEAVMPGLDVPEDQRQLDVVTDERDTSTGVETQTTAKSSVWDVPETPLR